MSKKDSFDELNPVVRYPLLCCCGLYLGAEFAAKKVSQLMWSMYQTGSTKVGSVVTILQQHGSQLYHQSAPAVLAREDTPSPAAGYVKVSPTHSANSE